MKQFKILALFILIIQNSFCQDKTEPPSTRIHQIYVIIQTKQGLETFTNKKSDKRLNGKYAIFKKRIIKSDIPLMSFANYIVDEGVFTNGYKNGLWKTTYKNKLVKTENWRKGLVVGRYKVYNTKGELLYKTSFGNYGHGKYKDYYYNTGQLKQEGSYENGKKQGEWCDYDKEGNLIKTTYYKHHY